MVLFNWKSKRVRSVAILLLILRLGDPATAVIGGSSLITATTSEEKLIKKVTVRLVYNKDGKFKTLCSGVGISPAEGLSGGHCFDSPKVREALENGSVFAEFDDPSSPGKTKRLQVDSMQRNQNEIGDFAYLKFRGRSPLNQSIPLAYSGCDEGSPYYVAGFGLDGNDKLPQTANFSTHRLLRVDERDQLKRNIAPKVKPQAPDWLVLKSLSGKTCSGDSGGPVFCISQGKLALAAVSAGIFDNNPTPIDPSVPDLEACQGSHYMSASKISTVMTKLEEWRNPPTSSIFTSGEAEK